MLYLFTLLLNYIRLDCLFILFICSTNDISKYYFSEVINGCSKQNYLHSSKKIPSQGKAYRKPKFCGINWEKVIEKKAYLIENSAASDDLGIIESYCIIPKEILSHQCCGT